MLYYLNKYYDENNTTSSKCSTLRSSISKDNQNRKTCGKFVLDATKSFYWMTTVPGLALISCIVLGSLASFYNVFVGHLPPSWFYTMADPDSKSIYFGDHLTKIWSHLAVFSIGLLAGVECKRTKQQILKKGHKQTRNNRNSGITSSAASLFNSDSTFSIVMPEDRKNQTKTMNDSSRDNVSEEDHENQSVTRCHSSLKNKLLNIIGGLVSFTVMSSIIFSTHSWSVVDLPEPVISATFDVLSRILWSLAFVWILYQLSVPGKDGNFSSAAKVLGHPVMVSLGKLSFLTYIIHPFVHTVFLAIQEQPIYSNWFMLFHMLVGNVTITVILSALVSLFIEMPCRNLFKRCRTSFLLNNA